MSYEPDLAGIQSLPSPRNTELGNLAWTVRFLHAPAGHEDITLRAIGPRNTISFSIGGRPAARRLSPADVNQIVRGNTDTDLKYLRAGRPGTFVVSAFLPSEQKHHALRAHWLQSRSAARTDIERNLIAQHAAVLAEPSWVRKLQRIGGALHLVQDSYSPAHTERLPHRGWCINYIRNYGAGFAPREHGKPADPRDEVLRSTAAAARAVDASRTYLQIVFKAILGRTTPDPVATREASTEFTRFVGDLLRLC